MYIHPNVCFEFPEPAKIPINSISEQSVEAQTAADELSHQCMSTQDIESPNPFSDLLDDLMCDDAKIMEPILTEQPKLTDRLETYVTLSSDLEVGKMDSSNLSVEMINEECPAVGHEQAGHLTVEEVHAVINENRYKTEYEKVAAVNTCFNQITYYSDMAHWGVDDYWATPFEFVNSAGGDCEDYALAKYLTLKEMGVAEDKLFVTYSSCRGLAHMVLLYYPTANSVPLVLDNVNKELLPLNQRSDLTITYSINSNGIWRPSNGSVLGTRVSAASDLNKWADFNKRLHAEGNKLYWNVVA